MSVLKWTMESAWAAVAVLVTAAGGIYTNVHHGGAVDQQISSLQSSVTKHDGQLNVIQQQNAATQQSLEDIKDTVHDIQTQVRHTQHGDNK
jgi:septal ring factor EnvC (AmiA/AmiB activator)